MNPNNIEEGYNELKKLKQLRKFIEHLEGNTAELTYVTVKIPSLTGGTIFDSSAQQYAIPELCKGPMRGALLLTARAQLIEQEAYIASL